MGRSSPSHIEMKSRNFSRRNKHVKEKTDDDFYILRNETLYYPLEYEMDSKAFLSHYLYPQEEDLFKVEVS